MYLSTANPITADEQRLGLSSCATGAAGTARARLQGICASLKDGSIYRADYSELGTRTY